MLSFLIKLTGQRFQLFWFKRETANISTIDKFLLYVVENLSDHIWSKDIKINNNRIIIINKIIIIITEYSSSNNVFFFFCLKFVVFSIIRSSILNYPFWVCEYPKRILIELIWMHFWFVDSFLWFWKFPFIEIWHLLDIFTRTETTKRGSVIFAILLEADRSCSNGSNSWEFRYWFGWLDCGRRWIGGLSIPFRWSYELCI